MKTSYYLIAAAWLATIAALVLWIPKGKWREAQVAFFFKQLITWPIGLLVVEFDLIRYPVRLFPHANATSFTFEFFIYPAICAIFNVHYPVDKSKARQLMQYVIYCSAITLVEVMVEHFTDIIDYIHWSWYMTWITLFITLYLARKYTVWFFKNV